MKIIRKILILLTIIGVWITIEAWMAHRVTPPTQVQSFAQFLAWHPNNRAYFFHQAKGHEYLEVLGSSGSMLSSGWGGYIFDESGHMIEWTVDSGDDSAYQKRWQESGTRQGITRDQAVAKYAATQPSSKLTTSRPSAHAPANQKITNPTYWPASMARRDFQVRNPVFFSSWRLGG